MHVNTCEYVNIQHNLELICHSAFPLDFQPFNPFREIETPLVGLVLTSRAWEERKELL